MAVVTYKNSTHISSHFNSSEFKCPECTEVRISTELINKVEELFSRVRASKCIVSSGYRSPAYDKKMNGFTGRHSEGLAMDCCFYDSANNRIPSEIICCVAFDLGFSGIARIDQYYVHLDIRTNGTYFGDETRGNSSYWTNPYQYFNISASDVARYTGATNNTGNKVSYQVYTTRWLPNVIQGDGDFAGIYGVNFSRLYIDRLRYRVRTKGIWLPEVVGREDYAGYSNGSPITDVAIQGATYRVHIKGGNWLPWVNGYNINDANNGYAGNGKEIDAIEIE